MAQANPGMTAGTYTLRGGAGDESALVEKPIYEANKTVLKTAFGENTSYCTDNSSGFSCRVSGLHARGYVHADDDSTYCYVNNDGCSNCEE